MAISLENLKNSPTFVIFDIQTIDNSEGRRLLELGWVKVTREELRCLDLLESRICTSVAKLPEDFKPRPIFKKLTGLSLSEIHELGAFEEDEIIQQLMELQDQDTAFVAHFVSFERSFLKQKLGEEHPLLRTDWGCTFNLAKSHVQGLPAYGIRAVAGHLGFPLSTIRRAKEHVLATAFILKELLDRNEVATWDDRGFRSHIQRSDRLKVPQAPGIYQFFDAKSNVLYVGKAKSLRSRVNSYFTGGCSKDARKKEMLASALRFETKVFETQLESAVAEYDFISTLQPPYNVALKGRTYTIDPTEQARLKSVLHGNMIKPNRFYEFASLQNFCDGAPLTLWGQTFPFDELRQIFLGGKDLRTILIDELPELLQRLKARIEELQTRRQFFIENRKRSRGTVEEVLEETDLEETTELTLEDVLAMLRSICQQAVLENFRQAWFTRLMNAKIIVKGECEYSFVLKNGLFSGPSYETAKEIDASYSYARLAVIQAELRREVETGAFVQIETESICDTNSKRFWNRIVL
jgi:DNA polymerase III epsilon subunit-like protein